MRIVHSLILTLAALAAGSAEASPLRGYTAEYEVLRNGSAIGRAQVRLQPLSGDRWELHSLTRGTAGLAALVGIEIDERSQFRWQDGRPETLAYRYRQSGAIRTRERRVDVDPAAGRVISTDRDREYRFDLQPGTLDRQAVTLAIGRDLAAGKRDGLEYRVVDRDDYELQRYRVTGDETVQVPAGAIRAVRVERVRETPGRSTTTWMDPAREYLPVRMVQREPKGETIEMRLVEVR
ncbi:DUF3108 domain-containing protein [Rehaibacterium terrae]|jgi:hypothetical protein|uniref:DUF3108 domain-containing protein n=1 Tax=Rehaibacterium terrae TaxID=1341696 RepID=A0A7W7XYC8_9GAMM|nr:DUF3108 domain-containing protein [Rehaibacterium terrae]MBB5014600.1 hypothetical protein [Rehaibacterium terrae]